MIVLELSRETAAEFWPEIRPFVSRALKYDVFNQFKISDIERQVREGFARVMICTAGEQLVAAHVLQIFKAIGGERVLHVLATAGDDSHLWMRALTDELEKLARTEGATAITMAGRPGWAKKLTKLGFKTEQITMRRPVTNGREIGGTTPAGAAIDNAD